MESIKFEAVKKAVDIVTYYDFARKNIENYLDYPIIKVDGMVTDLREEISENSKVCFETLDSKWGNRAYVKTLSLVFAMALKRLFPHINADLNHYIGSGLYIDFSDNISLTIEQIEKLDKEMQAIIDGSHDIYTEKTSLEDAKSLFDGRDQELSSLLNTIEDVEIGLVKCGDYVDINYSILAPNTSYIKSYRLMQYYPGILLIAPNKDNNYNPDNYVEMPKLSKVFQNSTNQFKMLGLNRLCDINKKILDGQAEKIIKISEAIFDKNLIDVAENINEDKDIKMILISGPTSSGKTTFTSRLKVHLEVLGYTPITISMDDYFLDREETPLDENGEYDFESPYAVNLELFNKDMYRLLNKEKIYKREFDFITGTGKYTGEEIVPFDNTIVMIEGIHALNPIISTMIPEKNKYKVYLSALNQVNLDSNNRVSTSNGRLIRRSVRDEKYRGYTVEETFKMWENIRKAEEMYIFPFQEEADVLINSAHPYETAILKKHILPHLEKIGKDSPYYNEAENIKEMLKYFVSIEDDSLVSSESLLREFIGK